MRVHEYPESSFVIFDGPALPLCVSIRKDEPMMPPLAAAATTAADN